MPFTRRELLREKERSLAPMGELTFSLFCLIQVNGALADPPAGCRWHAVFHETPRVPEETRHSVTRTCGRARTDSFKVIKALAKKGAQPQWLKR